MTQRTTLVLLALALGPGATGQGSASDYERSRTMASRVAGTVLDASLDEVWLDGSTLVFRHQTAGDRWRFRLADARTAVVEDAFDHAAVAAAIGRLGRAAPPADRLPLVALAGSAGRLLALPDRTDRVLAIDRATGRIESLAIEDAGAFTLEPTGARRSTDDGGESALLVANRTDQPVRLAWLDRGGERRPYGAVEPGAVRRQHTFAGHVWLVLGADDRELGRYRAGRRPGVVVVTGRAAPRPTRAERPAARSPDDRFEAFVRGDDVHLRDLATGETFALSTDGTPEDRYVGRFAWSPDSRHLVAIQEIPAAERTVHLIESSPTDRLQPRLHSLDYLKPGDRIARPRPRLFDVGARRPVPFPTDLLANPWSITRLAWSPDGRRFTFLYNQRGHQVLRLLEVEAATGAVRVVIEETSETFIDYASKTFVERIGRTDDWLWTSEASGANHLYRIDGATGARRPLTGGRWVLRAVDEVDLAAGVVRFRALGVHAGQDPYHVHFGRVGLDGRGLTWLTEGDGTHAIAPSPDRSHYVDTWSRVDRPPVHELRRSVDGSLVTTLAEADASALLATGWRFPERFVARGRDGRTEIWGVLFTPSDFDPAVRYPVVENIYAGPHGHFVPKAFDAWHASREVAELGFVVVQIDGMGTNWRSKAFHDVCWKNLADSGFPDRIAWLRAAAATRPYLDLERVGIYGGSAGGQSALRALLAHHDVYDAAVADCGCHDNRMDKIWWNELWMGWPIGPHYAEQSNATQAGRLEGDLLLIVGELDRNVDPASTLQVVDALIRADKDFELLVMPGVGHGAGSTPYGRRRRDDFFVRKLLGREPRWQATGDRR